MLIVLGRELRFGATLDCAVTQMVQDAIACRTKEVSAQGILDDECLSTAPELEQDVLYDLLGHVPALEHALGRADQRRVVRAEDRVERVVVAGTDAFEERAVVHRG
jgi:hypothetical protein